MDTIPASWTALCALAFVLGARHGLDADHLATIDGLTRYNASSNPRLARRAGALFSLGHGTVVLLVAGLAGSVSQSWRAPKWLDATGAGVSIAFLFGLAAANVHAVLRTAPDEVVVPVGFKGHLLSRFLTVRRSWAIALVGALFALSFDAISQAALFAVAGTKLGGVTNAVAAAAMFVFGMFAVDGANGLWISRLIRRADRTAAIASRVMAIAVALISVGVGVVALAKLVRPDVDVWAEDHAGAISAAVLAAVLASFALSLRLARRRAALSPRG